MRRKKRKKEKVKRVKKEKVRKKKVRKRKKLVKKRLHTHPLKECHMQRWKIVTSSITRTCAANSMKLN
jgi:hypothetical protein